MECKSLIEKNYSSKIKIPKYNKNGTYDISFEGELCIDGHIISKVLGRIAAITKTYGRSCKCIRIRFGKISFADKLTYIIFECMAYALIVEYDIKLYVYYQNLKGNITTCGIVSSLFWEMSNTNLSRQTFEKKFNMMLSRNHFRRVLSGLAPDDSMDLCILMSEIKSFLKFFCIQSESVNAIAEVVTELIDNAREHAKADCLMDIDVSDEIKNDEKESFCCINIAVVNFSDVCIGDRVERKFQKKAYDENSEKYVRYSKVEWAYMKHREKFSEAYGEEDFYNIVAFQDCITGRSYETDTGGTGLTELIKVLEQSVDEHYCYMLSGDRGINFKLDLLGYNEDNWIGFNYSKDFIGDVPSDEAIIRTDTQIQGTAYNFSVVVRKEN